MAKMTVIRHGDAFQKSGEGHSAEVERSLSPAGEKQVRARRAALGDRKFAMGIASPMWRTQQTVILIGEVAGPSDLHVLESLGWDPVADPEFSHVVDVCYGTLKSVPYAQYLAHEHGPVFEERGRMMWAEIQEIAGDNDVAVGHHEVLMNALGVAAAGDNLEVAEILSDTTFGKAEGYTLTFENGRCTGIELHQ